MKKLLKFEGGKGTVTDAEDKRDMRITRLMKLVEVEDPREAVKGLQIRFMY